MCQKQIILGIDPGSRCTGYGFIEIAGSRERVVDYGLVHPGRHAGHLHYLEVVYDGIRKVARRVGPRQCAVEMPVYGRNPQSMLKLGRAQAAAMMAVMHLGIPVTEYRPTEIKKSVTGRGNASKQQVAYMVQAILSIGEPAHTLAPDESDALAVALCHAHRQSRGIGREHGSWERFVRANPDRVVE